ncbi:bifunctional 2-polyprenyl-6-hydroxyphenol methylase/3-demethylubiquinol 3-O-methyltransferase UbiG [Acidithiobacillus sulfurivorans]|uniref:Ubiquinone biosynthesis O-methyltransferase n=1 Tax=Acidithiobacillus sulfurivorans TaxID=1958756 RepID=A0ABS5ZWP9_9PROT|nr:bifunctional 2-polyprenyl-6-hydroxyphenol methylase/3-demethylubiquinol 3-O-methyltransferase UbiG [Acidithiobacillus sulfurivorans]MBU2759594.1 bifunctional 2-polyprenyl-6-hydroxyphenol methylase/3-demethylubiquinol 3-O-methyltransferase UbiG [Acidithiobacillus sulfurivorans]
MNMDQAEVSKFDALASTWWDPAGPFRTLHEINPLRVDFIARGCQGLRDKHILDVGTGGGLLAEAMARLGANVTGIDLAADGIAAAQAHAELGHLQIQYRRVAVEELAEEQPESYDVVTCMEMLEHVPDPAGIIAACAKLLKPGGNAFFATLNRNPKSYLLAIVGAEYVLGLLPRGTHDYQKFIRPSELIAMTRKAQLQSCTLKGMHYDPIRHLARLNDDVTVNYLLHTQK